MLPFFFIFPTVLLISCGGVRVTSVDECIAPISIESTENILFYFKEVAGRVEHYSSLSNSDLEDNYLCYHDKTGSLGDQCDDLENYGVVNTLLPEKSMVSLNGTAVKTSKWGSAKLLQDFTRSTWFKGTVNDRVIWVNSGDLYWMFDENDDFKKINSTAYNALKLKLRIPSEETTNFFYEATKSLQNWDCTIK